MEEEGAWKTESGAVRDLGTDVLPRANVRCGWGWEGREGGCVD